MEHRMISDTTVMGGHLILPWSVMVTVFNCSILYYTSMNAVSWQTKYVSINWTQGLIPGN